MIPIENGDWTIMRNCWGEGVGGTGCGLACQTGEEGNEQSTEVDCLTVAYQRG